jgi:hypothetical protein
MRLQNIPNITFEHDDSRSFLKKLANTKLSMKIVFIYLDSHWYDDLPLREEIEIICNGWRHFVLMVDDFQVPGDSEYGYDEYVMGTPSLMNLSQMSWKGIR